MITASTFSHLRFHKSAFSAHCTVQFSRFLSLPALSIHSTARRTILQKDPASPTASTSGTSPTRCSTSLTPASPYSSFFSSRTAVRTPIMDSGYIFPTDKCWKLQDSSRTPLILVSCGSFSPVTYLHLRMFEMCKDWVKNNTSYEVVAAYFSPVSDAYKKDGLAKAHHRIEMCRRAVNESSWIMVDNWEADKPEYTVTALVLDHFEHEVNQVRGGVQTLDGEKRRAHISLLSGADLLQTMSVPGLWSDEDLEHILGRYGAFIIERSGTDMDKAMAHLQKWRKTIYSIPQLIQNDVSSTKIRNFLKNGTSIRYLIPEPALEYIDQHNLFRPEAAEESGFSAQNGISAESKTNGHLVNGTTH